MMMTSLWCDVSVVDYTKREPTFTTPWVDPGYESQEDILILWGGPGDINDETDEKMNKIREIIETWGDAPLLGVCLGCQDICKHLWLEVRKLPKSQQWVQNTIKLFVRDEKVGQYNSYAGFGKIPWCHPRRNQDKSINLIHAQEQKMLGVQFHPESVMTQNGREILKNLLLKLIK
jgi:2-amino-4-deoxychorismate synthase